VWEGECRCGAGVRDRFGGWGERIGIEQVDIDNAVVVDAIDGLLGSTHLALNELCEVQDLLGRIVRAVRHDDIGEVVVRDETLRLAAIKRGASELRTYPIVQQAKGLAEVGCTVSEISAYT
jgi:hypothetical protein